MAWSWSWLPSDPPASFGDNPFFDGMRLLVVLLAITLTLACGRILLEQRRRELPFDRGQAARFVALGLGLWYVALTELAVFGTPATPRLVVGLATTVFGLYGVHKMRSLQRHTPVVRN